MFKCCGHFHFFESFSFVGVENGLRRSYSVPGLSLHVIDGLCIFCSQQAYAFHEFEARCHDSDLSTAVLARVISKPRVDCGVQTSILSLSTNPFQGAQIRLDLARLQGNLPRRELGFLFVAC